MKENKKNRIFVIGGPSQLLFLVSALTQEVSISNKSYNDILILSGNNISDKRRDITKTLIKDQFDISIKITKGRVQQEILEYLNQMGNILYF